MELVKEKTKICGCRNLADEGMPPSVRIGDAEARRLGLLLTDDCEIHNKEITMSETEKVTTETTSETVAAPVTTDASQAKDNVEVSTQTTTVEKSDG